MQTGEQALNSFHETIELQLAAHAETWEWRGVEVKPVAKTA
jgi:hypothetical protein